MQLICNYTFSISSNTLTLFCSLKTTFTSKPF
nr:MAG TPA: hypothetical protein [Caudoviricetes sp.]